MKKQFVFVFCILVPVLGHAEPTETFKFGWAPFYSPNLTVDDSDGSTDSSQEFVALSAVAMYPFGRDDRWMANITKYDLHWMLPGTMSARTLNQSPLPDSISGDYV